MERTVSDILARRSQLHALDTALEALPLRRGDHVLNPGLPPGGPNGRPRDAAVLIGIIEDGGQARVILTKRHAQLRKHAGEIALPGGKIDPEDHHPVDAALREAREEIGLLPGRVTPIGLGDPYLSQSGYRIVPVAALVEPGMAFLPNPQEVDAVFEVPFGFLMDPANHIQRSRRWQGMDRHFWTMPYGDYYIWGVTAGILRGFWDQLFGETPAGPGLSGDARTGDDHGTF